MAAAMAVAVGVFVLVAWWYHTWVDGVLASLLLLLLLLLWLLLLLLLLLTSAQLDQLAFGTADCVHLGGCTYEASPVRSSCSAVVGVGSGRRRWAAAAAVVVMVAAVGPLHLKPKKSI